MTSFFTLPIQFISHEPETIVSFITSTRPFLNCSIVPVILSDTREDFKNHDIRGGYTFWQKLTKDDDDLKWYRLFARSDTLQFSSRMEIPFNVNEILFCQQILNPLIRDNPYFTSTLKYCKFPGNDDAGIVASLISQVRSLESLKVVSRDLITKSTSQIKTLPLRKLDLFIYTNPKAALNELGSSNSVVKNTLEEFSCRGLTDVKFLASFSNFRGLSLKGSFNGTSLDISPIGRDLVKLQKLHLLNYNLNVGSGNDYDTVEDCLSDLVELRDLKISPYHRIDSLSFLQHLPYLNSLSISADVPSMIAEGRNLKQEVSYIGQLPQLRSLHVDDWKIDEDTGSNEEQLEQVFESLVSPWQQGNLEEFVLHFSSRTKAIFSENGLSHLRQFLRKSSFSLRKLFIRKCQFNSITSLKHIFVDENPVVASFQMNNLERLSLHECRSSGSDGMRMTTTETKIEPFPNLKKLNLERCNLENDEPFCRDVVMNLRNLEEVCIAETKCPSCGLMKYLVPLRNLKSLTYDSFLDWKGKEEPFLKEASFVNLQQLSVVNSNAVDDETLSIIASKFPFLQSLSLFVNDVEESDNPGSKITVEGGVLTHLTKMKNLAEFRVVVSKWDEDRHMEMVKKSFHKSVYWYIRQCWK